MSAIFEYTTRPADPFERARWPHATEVVLLMNRKAIRLLGVFETREVAEQVAINLNQHSEFQVR